jgi:hypothetical protein
VELVRSGLADEVDNRGRSPVELGLVARLDDLELLNRVLGECLEDAAVEVVLFSSPSIK